MTRMIKMTGMTELEKKARKSADPRAGIGGEAAGGQSGLGQASAEL